MLGARYGRGYLDQGVGELPKPGLSVITVRKSVYETLLAEAKARGQSISQYLESQLQCGDTRTVLGQSQLAQNNADSRGTSESLVRPPGFEPAPSRAPHARGIHG